MFDVVKRIRAVPDTSAGLRNALREIEQELPLAQAVLIDAEQERVRLLLTADDRAVIAVDGKIQTARIAADRLIAASADLTRRVAEAEQREAREALDAKRRAIEARAAKLAGRLARDYADHGNAIIQILNDLAHVEDEIVALNAELVQAGRSDTLAPVEPRAIDQGGNISSVVSLRQNTALMAIGGSPGWGFGRDITHRSGIKG